MPRGNQILLLFILLLVIGAVSYYLLYLRPGKDYLPASLAVPASSIIVLQTHDISKDMAVLAENELYKKLEGRNGAMDSFRMEYIYFDSLINAHAGFRKALRESPLVASLHATAVDKLQLLILHQSMGEYGYKDIQSLMVELMPQHTISKREYEQVKVYEVRNEQKNAIFSFAILDGVLMLSRNSLLVEEAVNSYHHNSNKDEPMAGKMAAALKDNKIFINYRKLPELAGIWTSPQWRTYLPNIGNLGGFGQYDYKTETDAFMLNGLLFLPKGENSLFEGMLSQKPQQMELTAVLPQNTASFIYWGGDDFAAYHTHYKKWLDAAGKMDAYDDKKLKSQSEQNLDPEKDLLPWIGEEWAYALPEPASAENKNEPVLVIKPKDTATSLAYINELNEKVSRQLMSSFLPLDYRGHRIDKLSFGGVFELLFGEMCAGMDQPYFVKLGAYFIFSSSESNVRRYVDAFEDKRSLKQQPAFVEFTKGFASQSNFFFYLNPGRSVLLGKKYADASFLPRLDQNIGMYREVSAFGFQLVSNGDHFYNQINMMADKRKGTGLELAWKTTLDVEPAAKPMIVTNPQNGRMEILVQDKKYQLYLLDNTGNILWKRPLAEPIQGNVEMMDLYHNGQFQFLFATTNKVYLIDHEGKDAGAYPLRLASSTKSGIRLIDLKGNKDYQYFLQGNDRVYGFYADGQPIPNWSPNVSNGTIDLPLQMLVSKANAYFFGVTDKSALELWSDDGKKVGSILLGTVTSNPVIQMGETGNLNRDFYTVDTAGQLIAFDLTGKISRTRLGSFGPNTIFQFIDTDGNGKKEFVLSGNNTIAAYEPGKTKASWELKVAGDLTYPPQIIATPNMTWVSYTLAETGQVYMYSRAGTPFNGFPVEGTTPITVADVNGDNNLDMVVGNKDGSIYLYKLIY